VEKYGAENVELFFADVKNEDDSTLRFVEDGAAKLGCVLHMVGEGRSVWQVFRDVRMMGNPSNGDPCSRVLKRDFSRKWIMDHFSPEEAVIVYGLTWEESHRIEDPRRPGRGVRLKWRALGYETEFPMNEKPYWFKDQMIEEIRKDDLEMPDLYRAGGFSHNNCAGGCIKAGIGHYLRLLEVFPDRYSDMEKREREFQEFIGRPVTILRDRSGGVTTPISLTQLRERQGELRQTDAMFDIGGCGCMVDDE
jgi:hypothetical protein